MRILTHLFFPRVEDDPTGSEICFWIDVAGSFSLDSPERAEFCNR